jgi:hypothetical protein
MLVGTLRADHQFLLTSGNVQFRVVQMILSARHELFEQEPTKFLQGAPVVRGGDEHDPIDAETVFTISIFGNAFFSPWGHSSKFFCQGAYETVAGIDGKRVCQQSSLAVADDDHLPQGVVAPG